MKPNNSSGATAVTVAAIFQLGCRLMFDTLLGKSDGVWELSVTKDSGKTALQLSRCSSISDEHAATAVCTKQAVRLSCSRMQTDVHCSWEKQWSWESPVMKRSCC
jgi:hypothetical protein